MIFGWSMNYMTLTVKNIKKCQLTMSDNANKECKFQCNCKVDDCNDAVYSVGDKGLSVCEIYPIP